MILCLFAVLFITLARQTLSQQDGTYLDNKASPFEWVPSSTWEGNDGNWSTFVIRISLPPDEQTARVLPGTDLSETWIVSMSACNKTDITYSICHGQRGLGINTTATGSSWENISPYTLSGGENFFNLTDPKWAKDIGFAPRGDFGWATLGLGRQSTGPTLNKQIVANFSSMNHYLGFFGLSTYVTEFEDSKKHRGYLGNLYSQGYIPSESWGYQAGAAYRGRTRVASLVLGGYNAIRFQPNNVTFNLGTEQYKEIKAPLTSLTLSMTKDSGIEPINNILDKPINVSINSITSYIWLPKTACEKIEKAFNLTWNEAEQFYLLDDVTYQNLKKASPTFTFTLSNGTGDVHINIPYEALDLDIALPVLQMVPQNQTVKYLPIKRSWKEDQYTLGRAFLQEAYLQVDYHTRKFNISQARWPDEIDRLKTDIKAVYPKKLNATSSGLASPTTSTGLTGAQKGGIAVGVILGILVVFLALLVVARVKTGKWWPFGMKQKEQGHDQGLLPEMEAKSPTVVRSPVEIDGDHMQPREMDTDVEPPPGSGGNRYDPSMAKV